MKLSEQGINLVKQFEGFSAVPYKDTAGKPTIGYGHLIKPGEKFGAVSPNEAKGLLEKDVFVAEDVINRSVRATLNQNQFDALVSFVYNLGATNFLKSTLLKKLNIGDFTGAAKEFERWSNVDGKPSKGILNRRLKEKELFLTAV